MPDQQKISTVEASVALMKGADSVYFTEFKGLSAPKATELRALLRNNDIQLQVAKKTLIKIAAAEAGLPEIDEFLTGQMAMAFVNGDPTSAAKIITDFRNANNDVPTITGIILDGDALPGSIADELATLPSKSVLIAQLASTLTQPLTRLAGTLNGAMSKFVRTLSSYNDKKTS